MGLRDFLKELHRRRVYGVAVAYVATAAVLLEVLTHLFHNFDAPHWVLKVITTLLILGAVCRLLKAPGMEASNANIAGVQGRAGSDSGRSRFGAVTHLHAP